MTKVEEARERLWDARGEKNAKRALAALESAIREEERDRLIAAYEEAIAGEQKRQKEALRAEKVRVLGEVQRRIGHADSWSGKQVAEMLSSARAEGAPEIQHQHESPSCVSLAHDCYVKEPEPGGGRCPDCKSVDRATPQWPCTTGGSRQTFRGALWHSKKEDS